jgi:2'-5' RNA ligase
MRLFIAAEIPADVKAQLVALKSDISGATWVKPDAMHLTLRFLGDQIDPIRLLPIKTALESIKAEPFPVVLRGTGRFPPGTKRPARVLWVGIADQPALLALQASVERAVAAVGFDPEDRAFSPHITLARLKPEGNAAQVARFLEKQRAFRTEPFTVSAFYLISSLLTPQGPNYHHEASISLRD